MADASDFDNALDPAGPRKSPEPEGTGDSLKPSLLSESDGIPLKRLKLGDDVVEELPFAYFEKQPASAPVLKSGGRKKAGSSKDGLSAQKVEAANAKRGKETKESKDFRQLFSESENFKGWRLQEGPCAEGYYDPCLICSLNRSRIDKSDCRFYNRMLRSIDNPTNCRRLTIADARFFIDETKASTSAAMYTKDFWKVRGTGTRKRITRQSAEAVPAKPSRREAHFAAYTLQCIKSEFEKVVRREDDILQLDQIADGVFFSHSCHTNQICDVCGCSILNAHYCCIICGVELCWLCYDELLQPASGGKSPKWMKKLLCLKGVEHIASMFHLGSFLPLIGVYRNLLKKVEEQFLCYAIHADGPLCNGNHGRRYFQEEKCYCPRRCQSTKILDGSVWRIKNQLEPNALSDFKTYLALHIPVVVEGVNEHADFYPSTWSREALEKVISSQKKTRVLDCQTFRQAYVDGKACSVAQFWKRFDSKHVEGEPYLKIKDFPETAMFATVAKQQYANYFSVLPFLDYTHVDLKESGLGKLNLLNVLDEQESLVDPGPKAYIAVGACDAPHLASTPLHLDVSDSVNFLALVQSPKELSRGDLFKALEERLTLESVSDGEKERALKRPGKAGAIWKIFHPSDTLRLREAIMAWKRAKGEKFDGDVIHNQDVVVTPDLMSFLKDRGVHCHVFVQCEGEAVFVPCGAAHQVQNLNSCVKIAEDFVAVEGIEHVVNISNDLRRLKRGNDLIRVDTVLYRACSAAAETLSNYNPCLLSSSL